jgi:hypothetical protein
MLVTEAVAAALTKLGARGGTQRPHAQASFPNTGPGEGSLSNYRVVFIPDYLPSDSTLAQASGCKLG